jgi:hypothetical protein
VTFRDAALRLLGALFPAIANQPFINGDPHIITALVKRRAQLVGDIELAHEALRKMVLDLETLDSALLMFDPDYKMEFIKPNAFRPPKDWSNRGQMTLIFLSILRHSSAMLSSPRRPSSTMRILSSAET